MIYGHLIPKYLRCQFYFPFKTQFLGCLSPFSSGIKSQVKYWWKTQWGSSGASAQLRGPQDHQGDRLWVSTCRICPLSNWTNCPALSSSTDWSFCRSADGGSCISEDIRDSQVRRLVGARLEVVANLEFCFKNRKGRVSFFGKRLFLGLLWVTLRKNINSGN